MLLFYQAKNAGINFRLHVLAGHYIGPSHGLRGHLVGCITPNLDVLGRRIILRCPFQGLHYQLGPCLCFWSLWHLPDMYQEQILLLLLRDVPHTYLWWCLTIRTLYVNA